MPGRQRAGPQREDQQRPGSRRPHWRRRSGRRKVRGRCRSRCASGWPGTGSCRGPHQLRSPAGLPPAGRAAIQGLIERFLGRGSEPALLVVSALAEGADRLVATEVLAGPDATLEASLPLPPAEYLGDFTGDASKAEFNDLLGRAASVWLARPGASRDEGE